MSLKKEITLILLVVITLFTGLDYTVQRLVIFPSYLELDRSRARDDLERGLAALQREILHLDKLVQDWSARGSTQRFIRDRNAADIESSLGPETFLEHRLNAIFLVDRDGQVVWGQGQRRDASLPLVLAELPGGAWSPDSPLLNSRPAADSVNGVLLTGAGPMLIAARSIDDVEKAGTPGGTLILGRLLDQAALEVIAAQTGVRLSTWSCAGGAGGGERSALTGSVADCDWREDGPPGGDDLPDLGAIKAGNRIALREENGQIFAYALLPDMAGAGFLVLGSRSGRPISAVGRKVLRGAMLSLLCVGLLILVVLLEALKFSVLKPILLLTRHAEALRRSDSHGSHISRILSSPNEIGVLAREFDSMVDRLDLARRQLTEQAYYSGMTEMASGVIHNLRNALTPVAANLDLLKDDFRDLPLAQMKRSGSELEQGGVSGERREMLVRYLRESLDYLAEILIDVEGRLKDMNDGVARVEKILSDQEKFIAVNRRGDVIDLAQLVSEAVTMLNLRYYSGLELRLDPSLVVAGEVVGQRSALLHVFTNLLSNAIEASFRADRRQGFIEIRAVLEPGGEAQQVHVMIRDNGCGISAEDLAQLFARGYTTKVNASSGIGLHWCANTIGVMHGRLWAESGGPGQGTTLHLLLPKNLSKHQGNE